MSATTTRLELSEPMVLRDIPYRMYKALRDVYANRRLRMTFYDGTLEIMSPELLHDQPSRRLGIFVNVLCVELDIEFEGTASTTMRLPGDGPKKGKAKEPDQGFYIANAARMLGKTSIRLDEGDLPPDLWIEVDNRGSSKGRLPVYAALGVPEIWRYRARTRRLRFLSLDEGGSYRPIERSRNLPMLTPALVLECMALGDGLLEGAWTKALRAWVRAVPARRGGPEMTGGRDSAEARRIVADFVRANREPLASFVRQKIAEAGAGGYLDGLGRAGIEATRAEAAGVLVDLACALLSRLHPDREWDAQEILDGFPDDLRGSVRLPRSEAYDRIMAGLREMVERRSRPDRADESLRQWNE